MNSTEPERPDCRRCIHYYITHIPDFPYGCRALGFKSRQQPVLDVTASSGQPCHYFRQKKIQEADESA